MREGASMDGRRQVDKERGSTLQSIIDDYVERVDNAVPLDKDEQLDKDLAELDRKLEQRRQLLAAEEQRARDLDDVEFNKMLSSIGIYPVEVDDWSRTMEYILRMFDKNGLEDAKKAIWYLEKLIERMEDA